jgi:hypothetical protein
MEAGLTPDGDAGLARISHQLPAAGDDAPHPAVFSRLGVLDVLQVRAPRPSGRKPHCARHLAALATKAGEICGLGDCDLPQEIDVGQHHSGTAHDRRARLLAVRDR